MGRVRTILIGLLMGATLWGCGYNDLQGLDEDTKAAWSEVVNQYQRRADLIPNLVATVKGYAAHEKETLEGVVQARAQATGIQVTPEMLKDPAAFEQFQKAQAGLTSALGRLIAIAENYPNLKADQNFRDLQSQLEGTENRITVARKRYIDRVAEYNKMVRYFPTSLTAGAGKTIAIKATDGSEQVFKFTERTAIRTSVEAEQGAKMGALDSYFAGKEGTKVVVRYMGRGADKTATVVEDFGKESLKAGKGTVTHVDRAAHR